MFFNPDDSEILETWILISNFKFFGRSFGSTILYGDLLTFRLEIFVEIKPDFKEKTKLDPTKMILMGSQSLVLEGQKPAKKTYQNQWFSATLC